MLTMILLRGMRLLLAGLIVLIIPVFLLSCQDDPDENGDNDPNAPVKDIDENTYTKITIGQQVWLKENLTTTRLRTGDVLSNIRNNNAWRNTGAAAWSNYNHEDGLGNTYAKLYNWTAAANAAICPTGWHVPTKAEWETMITELGGEDLAGGKMKALDLWTAPNEGATNTSQFTALPGGQRRGDGQFENITIKALFWSSSFDTTGKAWAVEVSHDNTKAVVRLADFNTGASVRCLKD